MTLLEKDVARNLPAFLREDATGAAMTAAIQAAIDMFIRDVEEADAILTEPDRMPEWRLDEVAWENDITWYDHRASEQVKRDLVKTSQIYFGMLGTKRAIVQAVADYFGDAIVQEWWEYGGEPYHFRVYTSNPDAVAESGDKLKRIVELVKRASAIMDGIFVENSGQARLYIAAIVQRYENLTIGMR